MRLTAGMLVAVFCVLFLEGGARFVLSIEDEIRRSPIFSIPFRRYLTLDPYEMSPRSLGYHWVLRPGYSSSGEQLVLVKQRAGQVLGVRALQSGAASSEDRMPKGIHINSDGFRGPEIDKTHSRVRILSIGDSCTFGLGTLTYPRVLERALNEMGLPVEAINGGVEGYAPKNVIYEIERYKALKPELTTLYIGWNALYTDNPVTTWWERHFKIVFLTKKAARIGRQVVSDAREYALRMYGKPLYPNPDAPLVKSLETYQPSFIADLEKIINEMESIGSRVVLMTLPGLFLMDENPTEKALSMGHLPDFTENPFVLARMSERYNSELRALAARRKIALIDLDGWSKEIFLPRDAYFSDSVHLTQNGQTMIGNYMAKQLSPHVEKLRTEQTKKTVE